MEPVLQTANTALLIKIKEALALPDAEPSDHDTSQASQFLRFSVRLEALAWPGAQNSKSL